MKKGAKVALEFVDGSEKASLYTINFVGDSETEFGKFISKYKSDAILSRDYQLIVAALVKILDNGGKKSTKTYNEDLELSGYVLTLQKFEALIKLGLRNKAITIEETLINGYEDKVFQL